VKASHASCTHLQSGASPPPSAPNKSRYKRAFLLLLGTHWALPNKRFCVWNPHHGAGARRCLPVGGVKFSLDCESPLRHQTNLAISEFFIGCGDKTYKKYAKKFLAYAL